MQLSIMMGHDGSYQPVLDLLVCLVALAIGCSYTGLISIISIAEKTDVNTARYYCGEALGALLNTELLQLCTKDDTLTFPSVRAGCDIMGIVIRAHSEARERL